MLKNKNKRSQHGKLGEQKAVELLKNEGYVILERNWHKKYAEIDIVAIDKDTLVCVEVRARDENSQETPEESISSHKLHTLIRAIELYKSQHPDLPEAMRIDLVAVKLKNDHIEDIYLIKSITE